MLATPCIDLTSLVWCNGKREAAASRLRRRKTTTPSKTNMADKTNMVGKTNVVDKINMVEKKNTTDLRFEGGRFGMTRN